MVTDLRRVGLGGVFGCDCLISGNKTLAKHLGDSLLISKMGSCSIK